MRVTVLGAGVIGSTTAISLLDAGHHVRIIAADPLRATTSYLAAGVWFPTHAGPPDRVAAWSATTYDVLASQAAQGIPGVMMRESLALYRDPPGLPDWTAAVDSLRAARPAELPPGYAHGLRFVVPMVNMPTYLPWLIDQIRGRGGQLEQRRVGSLAEVIDADTDAVINCSGLASRTLLGDKGVHPVRGQIVRVTNPGLTMSVRDEHHPAGRAYVHPRTDDCILGGTLQVDDWNTAVDPATSTAIIERCRQLVPALRDASVIEHLVGLRPGRATVRVEEDGRDGTGIRILHNYGHGGSGITISWGCAYDVVDLLLTDGRP